MIVLTATWHVRDTQTLTNSLNCPVFAPSPDTAEDLVRKYGIRRSTRARSPDLAWLRSGQPVGCEAQLYAPGDRLTIGIEVFAGTVRNDVVLWIESLRVVIAGYTLADFGRGLQIPPAAITRDVTRKQVAHGLRPLLKLPVERVLPADRDLLERALA